MSRFTWDMGDVIVEDAHAADRIANDFSPLVAGFDPRELRNAEGRWAESPGSSARRLVTDAEVFDDKIGKARTGRKALRSAPGSDEMTKNDTVGRTAMHSYIRNSWSVNSSLRTGAAPKPEDRVVITELDKMMRRARTKKDVTTWRLVVDPKRIFGDVWSDTGDNSGLTWHDRGFTSTTVDPVVRNYVEGQLKVNWPVDKVIRMRILVPAGTRALHAEDDLKKHRSQHELLVNRDTTFRIVRDRGRDAEGVRDVDVEVIPNAQHTLTAAMNNDIDAIEEEGDESAANDPMHLVDEGPEVDVVVRPTRKPVPTGTSSTQMTPPQSTQNPPAVAEPTVKRAVVTFDFDPHEPRDAQYRVVADNGVVDGVRQLDGGSSEVTDAPGRFTDDPVVTVTSLPYLADFTSNDEAVDAKSEHTGAMIALKPRDADIERLAVDGGEDPEELHCTLCYLGEAAKIPDDVRERIIDTFRSVTPQLGPISVDAFAPALFNPGDENDRETCVVMLLSGPGLDEIHELTETVVGEVERAENYGPNGGEESGWECPEQHDPWIPHLTLVYTDDADLSQFTDRVGPVTFDRVCLAFGGDVYELPFGHGEIIEPGVNVTVPSHGATVDTDTTTPRGDLMPWHVDQRNGRYCVVEDANGSVVKCHGSKSDANAHLRALYANVPDAELGLNLDEHGVPIVPNTLFDLRDWVAAARERDVNLPAGPGHQLRDYWVVGKGAAKIRWNTEGDGTRCIRELRKYVRDPGGLCQEYHRMATGTGMHPHPGRPTEALDVEILVRDVPDGHEPATDESTGRYADWVADCDCPPDEEADMTVTTVTAAGAVEPDESGKCPPGYNKMPNGVCLPTLKKHKTTAAVDVPIPAVTPLPEAPKNDDCPPGHHRMPDGKCMPDERMPSDPGESYEVMTPSGPVAHWQGVLTVEGVESGDGRMFAPNSLSWSVDPVGPLMWQKETSHGGQGDVSVRVGTIQRAWRVSDPGGRSDVNIIYGSGTIDLGNPDGVEAYRRMRGGFLTGDSVDVDRVKDANVELRYASNDVNGEGGPSFLSPPELTVFHRGRIRGTTLVEFPAFTEASLSLVDAATASAPIPDTVTAGVSPPHRTDTADTSWNRAELEKRFTATLPLAGARRVFAWVDPTKIDGGKIPLDACHLAHHDLDESGRPGAANLTGCSAAIAALHDTPIASEADRVAVYEHLAGHLRAAGRTPPPYAEVDLRAKSLTAATTAMKIVHPPPREWFDEPRDVMPEGALTVTDEGRIFGYIAPAGVRHRSFPNRAVYVPMRNVDYSRFHSGETIVADGGRIVTGPVTMNCGHADISYDITSVEASDHYDNSCSIVASVRVGENVNGTWMAGGLLPDVRPDQVARIMACSLSGDWRGHLDRPGSREFVGALLVPVPGFPMARTSPSVSVSDGALVASAVPVRFVHAADVTDVTYDVPPVAGKKTRKKRPYAMTIHALAESIGLDTSSRVAALRSSLDIPLYFADISTNERKKLAETGVALPDGSYPIRNVDDLHNAIISYGRANEADRARVKRHIIKRARALGREDMIPDEWKSQVTNLGRVEELRTSLGFGDDVV